MPQRKSAKKELRKNIKRKKINLVVKSRIKKVIKILKKSIQNKNTESIPDNLNLVYKTVDRAASKKIIHPNKAARKKSRMAKLVHSIKQFNSTI